VFEQFAFAHEHDKTEGQTQKTGMTGNDGSREKWRDVSADLQAAILEARK
jgi:hypothetical protein